MARSKPMLKKEVRQLFSLQVLKALRDNLTPEQEAERAELLRRRLMEAK